MNNKPNILNLFFKYNTVAIVATGVDFIAFILLNDLLNIWYVISTFLSAIMGGITAFILNRNWVFNGKNKHVQTQIIKYILVWGGSIVLNTYGLYILVENSNLSEIISKILVTVIIGISYNFLMARFFIFK